MAGQYQQTMSHHVRVVNNSAVMTPNVISQPPSHAVTVPQVTVSTSMQPPVSSHNHNGVYTYLILTSINDFFTEQRKSDIQRIN